jgi:hypothetical protein
MARLGFFVALASVALSQGCSSAEVAAPSTGGDEGEVTVSLDLRNYEGGENLTIANETLVFPLARSPSQRVLSRSAPGDLVVAYTRVGCWVEPDDTIGQTATVPVSVAPTVASTLVAVSILFDAMDPDLSSEEWAQTVCLSFRPPTGPWQPFIRPSRVGSTGTSTTVEFAPIEATADAAAIFLPTYASVSGITYTLRPF